jgi:hypothetical protein
LFAPLRSDPAFDLSFYISPVKEIKDGLGGELVSPFTVQIFGSLWMFKVKHIQYSRTHSKDLYICIHIDSYMGRKTVALSLDEDIYEEYKKYCKENSIILSRKVETFMKKELEQNKKV